MRDLSCDRDAKTRNIAYCVARKRVKDFLEANADGLKQEIADQEMQEIKSALEGNSPEDLRKALSGKV